MRALGSEQVMTRPRGPTRSAPGCGAPCRSASRWCWGRSRWSCRSCSRDGPGPGDRHHAVPGRNATLAGDRDAVPAERGRRAVPVRLRDVPPPARVAAAVPAVPLSADRAVVGDPIGAVVWSVWSRPTRWIYPLIALLMIWPRSTGGLIVGNTDMWVCAFVALGLRYGWPALPIAIKPSFAPLMLVGIRHRSWWWGCRSWRSSVCRSAHCGSTGSR